MLGVGQNFAGYTVVGFLGAGGMGEVYLAQHPRLPRRRDALKLLGRDISADRNFRERFLREADLASTLSHQHIVGVHDRGEDHGRLWIAMDYIDGEDAAHLLGRRYPSGMPVELVSAIVTAVASALDYAHSRGLLHRDVKPANILLSHPENAEQRRILLTDFGIARALDDVDDLTPTNTTLGTVAYSAPEQLMGQELDGRADQYALAASAYHLLTGITMFPASNKAVIMSHHLSAAVPALARRRSQLGALDPVLAVALAKSPSDRFASCSDFARAFSEQSTAGAPSPMAPTAAAALPSPAPKTRVAATPTAPPAQPAASGSGRRWVGPTVVLGAFAAGVVWVLSGGHPESTSATEPTTPSAPPTISASPPATTTTESSTTRAPAAPLPSTTIQPSTSAPVGTAAAALLSAGEISAALSEAKLGANPAGAVQPQLTLQSSTYGPTDYIGKVTPSSCDGLVFTDAYTAYGSRAIEDMRTDTYTPGSYQGRFPGPDLLQQTAAVFPTSAAAQSFLQDQKAQWSSCSAPVNPPQPDVPAVDISASLGYENGRAFILGPVQTVAPQTIAVAMASNTGLNGPDACQLALGVRGNVVVEARTCKPPDDFSGSPMDRADPAWARPYAEVLVTAMRNKVGR